MSVLKKITRCGFIITLSVAMISCTKEDSGTLLGAIGGAFAGGAVSGNSNVGVAIGTLAGAYLGREVGRNLDEADQQAMYQSTQSALETGKSGITSDWYNPDSGNRGTVTPQPSFENTQGQYCREYQQTVTVSGQQETAYGTACRQPDGTWKINNS